MKYIVSSRIGLLLLQLDATKTLKIVQAYAPTSENEGEEVEEFYSELDKVLQNKSTYTVLMGDLNAKIGRGKDGGIYTGRQGLRTRNIRGERLVTMAESNKLYIGSSWLKKAKI
ncbi:hypothetical protein AB6A40_011271 [Gnathostoma spinigerum]|uniref:Craniofacial development protein 2 n=1 Tax=Gnathostoma spinigerum TaxID=75299 RepID=A0ABD6F447_9BILA